MRRRSFWFAFIALLMLAVSLSACLPPVPGSPSVGIYPAFAPFVSSCGGTAQLGQPISDPFSTSDNSICQYFENVIICEPANKPDEIYLHNLGQIYNPYPYSDAAVTVDPVFEPLYNTICGPAVLGNPISPRKYNPSLERYEQYFTNGAIYYDQNSTPENARLLPLGRRALDEIHKITPPRGPIFLRIRFLNLFCRRFRLQPPGWISASRSPRPTLPRMGCGSRYMKVQ